MNPLRPNVIIVASFGAILCGLFGVLLFINIGSTVSNEILALLVGIGIGGLFTLAGVLAQDPPPPSVPAGVHERLVSKLMSEPDTAP